MKKWTIRGIVYSALFAAIMMALSWLKFNLATGIPITLSTLGIMLAGSILGARYGFFSILLVVILAAAGFPALAGNGGFAILVGPSAGYIWAWPFGALLIGYVSQRLQGKYVFLKLLLANFVFGSLILYPTGVYWLAHHLHPATLSQALMDGMWPFLPGDLMKSIAAAYVTVAVRRVYPIERITGAQNVSQ